MIKVSEKILVSVIDTYGSFFNSICKIDKEKIAKDVLDEQKVHSQIQIFCQSTGIAIDELKNKKVLEVGSGFGIFVAVTRRDYQMLTEGIEPAEEGFHSSYHISRQIIEEYGYNKDLILNCKGENMPFQDNNFDIIFSSTVLEHVDNPELVLKESLRVLKPGGILHFVFPNHHAFFDGHYSVFHPPLFFNGKFFPFIVKYIYKRNPEFARTIRTELNYFSTKKMLDNLKNNYQFEYCTYGEKVFISRMKKLDFNAYAGLGKIKAIMVLLKSLKLNIILAKALLLFKMWDPIILTIKKQLK